MVKIETRDRFLRNDKRRLVNVDLDISGNFIVNLSQDNTIDPSAERCSIIGGTENSITGSADDCAIVGGNRNKINGNVEDCFVAGFANTAEGSRNFILGRNVSSNGVDNIVLGTNIRSEGSNSFRWSNGRRLELGVNVEDETTGVSNAFLVDAYQNVSDELAVFFGTFGSGNQLVGASLLAGQTDWTFPSDINLKENYNELDYTTVMNKVKNLKVYEWSYKGYSTRNLGVMAQNFYDCLDDGNLTVDISGNPVSTYCSTKPEDQKLKITNSDVNSITLAGLKGVISKLEEQETTISAQQSQISALQAENATQQSQISDLLARVLALENP